MISSDVPDEEVAQEQIADALEEILVRVKAGNTSGFDRDDTARFRFDISLATKAEEVRPAKREVALRLQTWWSLKHHGGIYDTTQLTQQTAQDLLKIQGIGNARVLEIRQALAELGMKLKGE